VDAGSLIGVSVETQASDAGAQAGPLAGRLDASGRGRVRRSSAVSGSETSVHTTGVQTDAVAAKSVTMAQAAKLIAVELRTDVDIEGLLRNAEWVDIKSDQVDNVRARPSGPGVVRSDLGS
jgi:hypothetical protein